jgi:ribosome-associated translation inhibitor RaiA
MDIVFHAHRAVISERLRARAERAVTKLARRVGRAIDAVVRFERDGPTRRVKIELHASRHRRLVAEGRGRYYGPALTEALAALEKQVPKKKPVSARGRAMARA